MKDFLQIFSTKINECITKLIEIDNGLNSLNEKLGFYTFADHEFNILGLSFVIIFLLFGCIFPLYKIMNNYIEQIEYSSKINIILFPIFLKVILISMFVLLYFANAKLELNIITTFSIFIVFQSLILPSIIRRYTNYVTYNFYKKKEQEKEIIRLNEANKNKLGKVVQESYVDLEKGVVVEEVREKTSK